MPKVFVINQPLEKPTASGLLFDVSPALQYGSICYVFLSSDPSPSSDPDAAVQRAVDVLSSIEPCDFLVWAGGDPLGLVIASTIAADYLGGEVNFLRWNRARSETGERVRNVGFYSPVRVTGLFEGDKE